MTLDLIKKSIEDEGETFWNVRCQYDGGDIIVIPYVYTFPSTKTNQEMQDVIIPDLTSKGYIDLSPINWIEE